MNYYNEWDKQEAQWIRNLIAAGLIPAGDVDERSITEVSPRDLAGYTQCHFFAGYAGWSLALRAAGWPDKRPIWTGSCPCQPFSSAGSHKGTADPRHLWPDFHRLISDVRPPFVMGEQVAGSAGYGWFDGVQSDLEAQDYASRAVDIPACSVNAPHRRNRLFWVASDLRTQTDLRVDDATCQRCQVGEAQPVAPEEGFKQPERCGGRHSHRRKDATRGLADSNIAKFRQEPPARKQSQPHRHPAYRHRGHWDHFTLIGPDPDGKCRRIGFIESPVRRLADGRSCSRSRMRTPIPILAWEDNRPLKLKALGNGMVLPLVTEVIRAWMD